MAVDVGGGRVASDPPGYACLSVRSARASAASRLFLARRLVDGSDVVLRIFVRTVASLRDRQRFEREVAGLAALADVPNVLPILDADVRPSGQAFVVTAYCVAGSLHDHVCSMGRLSAVEASRVGVKLAGALAAMHRRGVVHRNITPSNVLVDGAGEPVLTDFGLASLSVSGTYLPEPGREPTPFLAPEAYLPELMTPSADIFALGATLYALLGGSDPRGGEPASAAVRRGGTTRPATGHVGTDVGVAPNNGHRRTGSVRQRR